MDIQPKNASDCFRFGFIDDQAFFLATSIADGFGFNSAIAERWLSTIEKTLPGIFQHRACGVFTGFFALEFIKDTENFPHHVAGCVFAGRLGD
nr:hypothetical protein [Methylomonas sp. 11b]